MNTVTATKNIQNTQTDFLPLQGTDYVEFYVGNAKQAAHFYKTGSYISLLLHWAICSDLDFLWRLKERTKPISAIIPVMIKDACIPSNIEWLGLTAWEDLVATLITDTMSAVPIEAPTMRTVLLIAVPCGIK